MTKYTQAGSASGSGSATVTPPVPLTHSLTGRLALASAAAGCQ